MLPLVLQHVSHHYPLPFELIDQALSWYRE
jgi:hypothetical protein